MNNNCVFCSIIEKKIPADILFESAKSIAFRDINPQAPVHILIIPKIHISSTINIDKNNLDYIADMIMASKEIAKIEKMENNGYRWVVNTGIDGGQTVDHLHLHCIGGRSLTWPPG